MLKIPNVYFIMITACLVGTYVAHYNLFVGIGIVNIGMLLCITL